MAIEIVDFPIKNGGSFHCYVSSPEGTTFDFEQGPVYRENVTSSMIDWSLCLWPTSSHGDQPTADMSRNPTNKGEVIYTYMYIYIYYI